jgi:nudix-type nucleoside diphosphatase (YffH/AdpP family)
MDDRGPGDGRDKRVVVHEQRRVFDGFFKIDEAVVSYQGFDGRMIGPLRRLSFERGDSVAAVVLNRDRGSVVLANQFRYPTHAKGPGWITEILAGMVDAGETPEQCVRREVREESGYDVEQLQHIGTFYLSPGGSSERIILYYAEVSDAGRTGAGGGQAGEGEDIQVVEVSLDQLERDVAAGRIDDAKTLVGILWLLAARRRSGR